MIAMKTGGALFDYFCFRAGVECGGVFPTTGAGVWYGSVE